MRSRFSSQRVDTDGGPFIAVVDMYNEDDPCMSVTNDAENVVKEVVRIHGDLPVLYKDTEGQWDELRHEAGRFTGFGLIQNDHWRTVVRDL